MRKIEILLVSILSILIISSCDTKHNGPFLSATPGSPSITSPKDGASYVLQKDKAQDTLFTMKWDPASYGYKAAVDYSIELSKQGDNFSNPVKVGDANLPTFSISVGDMNTLLMGLGYTPGQAATVQMRVNASITDSVGGQMSNPISMTFTPYSDYSYIYVPGDYQAASGYTNDWSPADAPPLAMVGNKTYEGYVYMINSAGSCLFKFTNDQTWDLNWGAGSTPGSLAENASNLVSPDTGYYKINVDLNAMTYTMLKTTWAVIGDATPGAWDTGTPMKYDPVNKVWTVTMNLTAGNIKFRANGSWDLNYGDGGNGMLVENGNDNIPVATAGKYKIIMDLSNPPLYKYSLIKQ